MKVKHIILSRNQLCCNLHSVENGSSGTPLCFLYLTSKATLNNAKIHEAKVRVCMRACVRECVRACVRVCVCGRGGVRAYI